MPGQLVNLGFWSTGRLCWSTGSTSLMREIIKLIAVVGSALFNFLAYQLRSYKYGMEVKKNYILRVHVEFNKS